MKRTLALLLAASMTLTLLSGCKSKDATDLKNLIDQKQPVKIETLVPSTFSISTRGSATRLSDTRLPLEKETSYSDGFRQNFDTAFNINTITDGITGDGKQGCLYVINMDGQDVRSGSTSLADAFRNKKFVEYWKSSDIQNRLIELGSNLYEDMDINNQVSIYAALNAYYNLFPDGVSPTSFNPTQTLSREEFYSFLFRAMNGTTSIAYEPSGDMFVQAVGVDTPDTKYAKQVEKYGWLKIDNHSLDINTINDKITRAEAIYMVIQMCLPDIYEQMSDGSPGYADTKSNGDLALKLGFKDSETGVEYDRWQAFVLAYMVRNPNKGMQSELYRAMAAAKALNLVSADNIRWNESIAKFEAIDLVIAACLRMNDQYGYATSVEYATISAPVELPKPKIPDSILTRIERLTELQIEKFREIAESTIQDVKDGKLTENQANLKQQEMLDEKATDGVILSIIADLFPYWKYLNGYADEFPNMSAQQGTLAGENINDYDEADDEPDDEPDKPQGEDNQGEQGEQSETNTQDTSNTENNSENDK